MALDRPSTLFVNRLDLYSLFRGTTSDISALIDVMPSYLFPRDEKEVVEFWSTGISLGGQSQSRTVFFHLREAY